MPDFSAIQQTTDVLPDSAAQSRQRTLTWVNERRLAAAGLALLVVASVALRLVPIVIEPSINWWDEVFQSTEQAHRLVFGYGLVPWEFQLGMRSWLLPGAVAGILELSRLVGDGPRYYLPIIAACFGMVASAPVICCFLWARRWFGLSGALAGAALVAIAPELVYFGARAFSETVAAHLLVIGCFLLYPADTAAPSRRRLFIAGIVLGIVCLLRVQLTPAVLVAALWTSPILWRQRLPTMAGGLLLATACGAVIDWLTLGFPLASLWRNVLYNVIDGVSAGFGTEPWNYYLLGELGMWGGGAVFMLVTVALGARRAPYLLAAALAIIAVHSAIAHKEYRFIYPAVSLLMVLAGVGMAQLTQWGAAWLGDRGIDWGVAPAASAALLLGYAAWLMLGMWTGQTMVSLRSRVHDNLLAAAFVARQPALCGVGLYGEKGLDWARYGGYTYLHRPVPMYWPEDEAELAATAPAFDTLLYTAAPPADLGFKTLGCFGNTCVAHRAGGCIAKPMPPMPYPKEIRNLAPPQQSFLALPIEAGAAASP